MSFHLQPPGSAPFLVRPLTSAPLPEASAVPRLPALPKAQRLLCPGCARGHPPKVVGHTFMSSCIRALILLYFSGLDAGKFRLGIKNSLRPHRKYRKAYFRTERKTAVFMSCLRGAPDWMTFPYALQPVRSGACARQTAFFYNVSCHLSEGALWSETWLC